jgi:hypothetical protein
MEPSKWQTEFNIRSEDRLFSKKPRPVLPILSFKNWSIIIGAVFVIAVIGYSSYRSSRPPLSENELPLIKAPEKPYKIKPASNESDGPPLKAKAIYEKLAARKPDEKPEEKIEHILQAPEEPAPPPPTLPEEFIDSLMEEENVVEPSPQNTRTSPSKIGFSDVSEETEIKTENPSISQKGASPLEEGSEKQSPITISGSSLKAKKVDPSAEPSSSFKGTHWVQLASLKSKGNEEEDKKNIESEWKRLVSLPKVKPLLKDLKPHYSRVDMGQTEGIHVRLRIGRFSFKEAKNICRILKEHKVDCMVKKA